jgi:hypothetical protein
VGDACDNCTLAANRDQRDTNGDGFGYRCDADLNNDGQTNTIDLDIYRLTHRKRLGDAGYNADADFNGDSSVNTIDLYVLAELYRKPPGPGAPPPPGQGFSFVTYGDSRAGSDCKGNKHHIFLVQQMVSQDPAFVVHNGDMIQGYDDRTNFIQDGSCTAPDSYGSLRDIIAPLQSRQSVGTLPTAFFPLVGNHDDGWSTGYYPDPFDNSICDVFDMPTLVPNHTQQPYFSTKNSTRFTDTQFDSLLCSTDISHQEVYLRYAYYSFNYQRSHFVILRVNTDTHNLEACNNCSNTDRTDYANYRNIHQLDLVRSDLAAARANPEIDTIFVFLHAPLFGTSSSHPNNPSWRAPAREFTNYGVKAVFSRHNHAYERSVPVVVDATHPDGARDDTSGTVYFTTGVGGSPLSSFNPTQWYTAFRSSDYHYLKVNVEGERVSIEALAYDPSGPAMEALDSVSW